MMMENVSYSAFRSRLARMLDKVNEDRAPLLVTRQNGSPAVVMSLEDFSAYEETAYLMASPKNAQRLSRAVAQAKAGKTRRHKLVDA